MFGCLLFVVVIVCFFVKQKTAYEMRISDWSSDVGSSDLKKIVSDLQASGHEIIDLTIGEPDIATPAHIVDGALAAMRSGETHYTPSAGTLPLRRAVADTVLREKGLACGPENVAVGCGAKQLVFEGIGRASGRERVCHEF